MKIEWRLFKQWRFYVTLPYVALVVLLVFTPYAVLYFSVMFVREVSGWIGDRLDYGTYHFKWLKLEELRIWIRKGLK